MATQRVAASKPVQEEKNGQINGASKASAVQSRQAKKLKVQEEDRLQRRLRWAIVVVVLVLAALAFYFYYTTDHLGNTPAKTNKRTPLNKSTPSPKDKPSVKKKPSAKDKLSKQNTAKAKKSPVKGKEKKPKGNPNGGDKPKTEGMKKFEKLKNRLLRQPIPASDVDRPHALDIITGDNLIVDKKYDEALERFNAILKQFPQSPRAQFGKGITLAHLAEQKRSNKLMDSAISFFKMAGNNIVASELIKVPALAAMSDKAQRRGDYKLAVEGMEKLVALKPDSDVYSNQLGILYLTTGKKRKAKNLFKKLLKQSETNYYASAQLGAIYSSEKQYEKALPLLMEGIRKDLEVRNDGKFYNYAGEALVKLNRSQEAQVIYGEAVKEGVFPSIWQRPLMMEKGLTALPWWSADKMGYFNDLTRIEKKMDVITSEARGLFDKDKLVFTEAGTSSPHFVLYTRGKKNVNNCARAARTCALLETFPEAAKCKHCTVKFSSLPSHTHIGAHVGLTNTKLQVLVGLHVDSQSGIRVRVAEEIKLLGNKQIGILDESFEKEVWYDGEEPAVYMTIDVWHPDLSEADRLKL